MENAVCAKVRRAVHVRRVAGRVLVHEGQCQQGDADEAPGRYMKCVCRACLERGGRS